MDLSQEDLLKLQENTTVALTKKCEVDRYCSICLERMKDHVCVPCGHRYCGQVCVPFFKMHARRMFVSRTYKHNKKRRD